MQRFPPFGIQTFGLHSWNGHTHTHQTVEYYTLIGLIVNLRLTPYIKALTSWQHFSWNIIVCIFQYCSWNELTHLVRWNKGLQLIKKQLYFIRKRTVAHETLWAFILSCSFLHISIHFFSTHPISHLFSMLHFIWSVYFFGVSTTM